MKQEKKPRKKFTRSPGYPMISLEEAIGKAQILWDRDKKNAMPLEAVYAHLGYKALGGYGARVIAALKKFDLIYGSKGSIVLTNWAVDLMLHNPTDEEYIQSIKASALKPSIYEKLYNEYNGILPSDQTIRIKLIKEYDFNPVRVNEFIEKFRETISFANLTQQDLEREDEGEDQDDDSDKAGTQSKKEREGKKMIDAQVFNIPLIEQNTVTLAFTKLPIVKRDLDRIKQWLDLMEEPLVKTEETKEKENDDPLKGL